MSYNSRRSFSGRNQQTTRSYKPQNRNRGRKRSIDPSLFVNKTIATDKTPVYESRNRFSDFEVPEVLKQNIIAAGFEVPTAIQDQTIPFGLQGKDVIGLANTGTGKTVAFLLPVLTKLYERRTTGSVLVMAPTRELAQQIDAEFKKFSAGMKVYSAVCVGGVNISGQIRQIKRGPHVIIGTPGRLKDLMQQKILQLDTVNTLILDEADRMLDMGFINDIRFIVQAIPKERQTLCFSATMSDGIKLIVNDFMRDPELVSVKQEANNNHIYQDVVSFNDDEHKKTLLLEMLQQPEFSKVIVFGETKFGVQRLSDRLEAQGVASRAIHGNKNQGQRNRALASLSQMKSKS
jgi:ATP-dependent RNA helicase RhlE